MKKNLNNILSTKNIQIMKTSLYILLMGFIIFSLFILHNNFSGWIPEHDGSNRFFKFWTDFYATWNIFAQYTFIFGIVICILLKLFSLLSTNQEKIIKIHIIVYGLIFIFIGIFVIGISDYDPDLRDENGINLGYIYTYFIYFSTLLSSIIIFVLSIIIRFLVKYREM